MKLFLTWLLGVPVLVLAMVLARAMSPHSLQPERPRATAASPSVCDGKRRLDDMGTVVLKNGQRISCHRLAVQ
jgi:hypothetical protein